MLKADRTQTHALVDSMNPVNIIKENSAIPIFVFKYFAQKNMSELIDQTFKKSRLFEFSESYRLGINSILIEIVRFGIYDW